MSYARRNRREAISRLAKNLQKALPGVNGERYVEVNQPDLRYIRCGTVVNYIDTSSHVNDVDRSARVFSINYRHDGGTFLVTTEEEVR